MKPQMNTDKYGSASVCVHLWFRMLRPVGFRLLCFELLFFGLLTQHAGSGAYQGEDGEVRKLAEGVYVRIAAADQSIVSNANVNSLCERSEEHTSELQSHHDLVCRLR